MKKIGKEVLFMPSSKENPRNGEGAFILTKDGRIMFAYTQYYASSWDDHGTARVAAVYSADQGETWSEPEVLVEKGEDDLNIMSMSLLRMENGDLGLMYLRKFMRGDKLLCMPYLTRSADEGKTFCAPLALVEEDGYYIVNNDRFARLKNGRILVPITQHGDGSPNNGRNPGHFFAIYSDDDGKTWRRSKEEIYSPYADDTGFAEAGLHELADGKLWMYCRSTYGFQYQSFSTDGGDTWSPVMPAFRFTSPDAPMLVKQVGKYTVAIFNPLAYNCVREDREFWGNPKRTPFVCAVSTDGGLSFADTDKTYRDGDFDGFTQCCRLLEDDTTNSYCYPAVIEVADGFLVAYYHSNGTNVCLNTTKITKVYFGELD